MSGRIGTRARISALASSPFRGRKVSGDDGRLDRQSLKTIAAYPVAAWGM